MVRRLAELGLTVVLTSRDVSKGIRAIESLKSQGLQVQFRQLDVANPTSIHALARWLRETFGGLDILVSSSKSRHPMYNTHHAMEIFSNGR